MNTFLRNFFYAVGIVFLAGILSMDPERTQLRDILVFVQSSQFWWHVGLGTPLLIWLQYVGPQAIANELKVATNALERFVSLFSRKAMTGVGAVFIGEPGGGHHVPAMTFSGPGARGRDHFVKTVTTASKRSAVTQQYLEQAGPFSENEDAELRRLWQGYNWITLEHLEEVFRRPVGALQIKLVAMGLCEDLAAVINENRRRRLKSPKNS
jgi:hypothetical protein